MIFQEDCSRFPFFLYEEQGQAKQVEDGWELWDEVVVTLDSREREQLRLPAQWRERIQLKTKSIPADAEEFKAWLEFQIGDRPAFTQWEIEGPILRVGGDEFLLTKEQFEGIQAFKKWESRGYSNEVTHLRMLNSLGLSGEQVAFETSGTGVTQVLESSEITIVTKEGIDGKTTLVPYPITQSDTEIAESGVRITEEELEKIVARKAQVAGQGESTILRIDNRTIILDKEQTTLARRIFNIPKLTREERETFDENPTDWLCEKGLLDQRIEEPQAVIPAHMPRVLGIGYWKPIYGGASDDNGEPIPWFEEPEEKEVVDSLETDSESSGDRTSDSEVEATEDLGPITHLITANGQEVRFGRGWGKDQDEWVLAAAPDFGLDFPDADFKRTPKLHQERAIRQMLAHTLRIPNGDGGEVDEDNASYGAGMLLADDMGLGKTASTLFFVDQWWRQHRLKSKEVSKAALIVAPVSVMNEWKNEIAKTFSSKNGPFKEVIFAHRSERLFRSYFREGMVSDDVGDGENGEFVEEFALRFGEGQSPRIDEPGTLVITNYDTLRRYRFSFARAEWSVAVFDEAHALKNPNALQTIAAKTLKADFRVALTGTPIENRLSDLWSLMDFVEPDALGLWKEFKERYVKRSGDEIEDAKRGDELRSFLGSLVLRRLKTSVLGDGDIPPKVDEISRVAMKPAQGIEYEEIRAMKVTGANAEVPWLTALWELRRISLHPDLRGGGYAVAAKSKKESRKYLAEAGKTDWLVRKLDEIERIGEKVIIFAVQKNFQLLLRDHLSSIYGLKIGVINGDTKTKSRSQNTTRSGIIDEFTQAVSGFQILILSPIAAGAGLNIQAANHVIHLERHWNPAKEDQATARAWRMGSQKKVHVYFPLLCSPSQSGSFVTFDENLNEHIERKRKLAGDVGFAAVSSVKECEVVSSIFSETSENQRGEGITLDDVAKIDGYAFEGLVAEIYQRDGASKVQLTPRSSDGGADILVFGYGSRNEDILVECKHTITPRNLYNSEKEIERFRGGLDKFNRHHETVFSQHYVVNHRDFHRRSKKAFGESSQIEGFAQKWLQSKLKEHKITGGDLLKWEGSRVSAK